MTGTVGYVGHEDAERMLTFRSRLCFCPRSSQIILYEAISSRESSISRNICSRLAVKPAPHSADCECHVQSKIIGRRLPVLSRDSILLSASALALLPINKRLAKSFL